MLQHGAYLLLMDSIYDREKFPTMDEAIEWTWASSKEEVEAVEFVLGKFFKVKDGKYFQTRMLEVIEEYTGFCLSNQVNGKKGGRPKGAKNKPKETQSVNNKTHSVKSGSKINPNKPDHNPNHKPLTTNQEPLTKNHKPNTSHESCFIEPEEKHEIDQRDLESYGKMATVTKSKRAAKKAKKQPFELPFGVCPEVWAAFELHRSKSKTKLTDQARVLAANKLAKFSKEDQQIAVEESIVSGWTGIFPKENNGTKSRNAEEKNNETESRLFGSDNGQTIEGEWHERL